MGDLEDNQIRQTHNRSTGIHLIVDNIGATAENPNSLLVDGITDGRRLIERI